MYLTSKGLVRNESLFHSSSISSTTLLIVLWRILEKKRRECYDYLFHLYFILEVSNLLEGSENYEIFAHFTDSNTSVCFFFLNGCWQRCDNVAYSDYFEYSYISLCINYLEVQSSLMVSPAAESNHDYFIHCRIGNRSNVWIYSVHQSLYWRM